MMVVCVCFGLNGVVRQSWHSDSSLCLETNPRKYLTETRGAPTWKSQDSEDEERIEPNMKRPTRYLQGAEGQQD